MLRWIIHRDWLFSFNDNSPSWPLPLLALMLLATPSSKPSKLLRYRSDSPAYHNPSPKGRNWNRCSYCACEKHGRSLMDVFRVLFLAWLALFNTLCLRDYKLNMIHDGDKVHHLPNSVRCFAFERHLVDKVSTSQGFGSVVHLAVCVTCNNFLAMTYISTKVQ